MLATANRIARQALEPGASADALVQLAQSDATFATKFLALVNTPAFAGVGAATSISQAAALLGVRGVRTVALSLLVASSCPVHGSCRVLMANALRRALACRCVAAELGQGDLEGAFATGLLLDSGLFSHGGRQLQVALSIAMGPAHHRVLRERAEGLVPHPLLGSELAESYELPVETVDAIRDHHEPNPPEGLLARSAWLAESVAGVFENPDVERARERAIAAAERIALAAPRVETILAALPVQVAEVARVLGRDIGELHDLEALRNDAGRLLAEINQQYEGVIAKLGGLLGEKEQLTEELRRANLALAGQAHTDALTGLPNRRALEHELARAAARAAREGSWLSLLAMDIDHFKTFNDTHGHAAGDAVLATVGKTLPQQARKGDVPTRYGGEEFTVILPNTNPIGATIVAERMRRALEVSETIFSDKTLRFTVSIGVASAQGERAEPVTRLASDADEALYTAKRAGRNRVAAAKPAIADAEKDAVMVQPTPVAQR